MLFILSLLPVLDMSVIIHNLLRQEKNIIFQAAADGGYYFSRYSLILKICFLHMKILKAKQPSCLYYEQ